MTFSTQNISSIIPVVRRVMFDAGYDMQLNFKPYWFSNHSFNKIKQYFEEYDVSFVHDFLDRYFHMYFHNKDAQNIINIYNSLVYEYGITKAILYYTNSGKHSELVTEGTNAFITNSTFYMNVNPSYKYISLFNTDEVYEERLVSSGFEIVHDINDLITPIHDRVIVKKGSVHFAFLTTTADAFLFKCNKLLTDIKPFLYSTYSGPIPQVLEYGNDF